MDISINSQNNNVKLSDIIGLEKTKQSLLEQVVLPVRFPQLFTRGYQRLLSNGILLYGPPGTGKSHLIKAISTEANNSKLFSICLVDILKKFSHESGNFIKSLFETACVHKPSIIFIDKIELLCSFKNEFDSDSVHQAKIEFQIQMDILREKNDLAVFVLAASNFPWYLDSPIKKRFDSNLNFPLPTAEERQAFFKLYLKSAQHNLTSEDFVELANKSEGYSGGDINIVVQNALASSIRSTHQENSDSEKIPTPNIANSQENSFETELEHLNSIITKFQKKDILNAFSSHKSIVNEDYLEKILNFSAEF